MVVFCYGEVGVDNLIRVPRLPSPEVAVFPTNETYTIGGAAANTAVWLGKWNVDVGLSGNQVGVDRYGQDLLDWLSEFPSINLDNLVQDEVGSTPYCRVMVTPDGERSFLIFGYPQSPKTILTREMLGSSKFLALDLYGGQERLAAARVAHELEVSTVIGDVIWLEHEVLPLTSIATNSGAYIRQEFPGIDLRDHSRKLQAGCKGIVVTTDGAGPIHVIDPEGAEFSVLPPRVEPRDATGAGDAFRAGLIYGLIEGWTLEQSVCFGAAAGAFSVQQEGAASNPIEIAQVRAIAETLVVESSA
jgi:sugar/nucleoside kinase (ribokinase family)